MSEFRRRLYSNSSIIEDIPADNMVIWWDCLNRGSGTKWKPCHQIDKRDSTFNLYILHE